MNQWEYFTATLEDGWVKWDDRTGHEKPVILSGALRLFGSQGYELITTIRDDRAFGRKAIYTLIFKRPFAQR